MKTKLSQIREVDQTIGRVSYEAFENELNLCALVRIEKDRRQIGAFLLNQGDISDSAQFQVVFAFSYRGLHDRLYREEVLAASAKIQEAFKFLPPGEKCSFVMGCYSDCRDRLQYLDELAQTTELDLARILVRSEQAKVQELTAQGVRQKWEQLIFCTWTSDEFGERKTDPLSQIIYHTSKSIRFTLDALTGRLSERQEQVLRKVLLKSYSEGFLRWEILLNTQAGLEITPLTDFQLWAWLWKRFNSTPTPPIPQLLILGEEPTEGGMRVREVKTTDLHATSVLIMGDRGKSACPQHRQSPSRIYVNDKICGVLTMNAAVKGWPNLRQQLAWMWEILSQRYVRDTEVWVELSAANKWIISENLNRQAKQSKAARIRALEKGAGRDVGAEVKQDESFEAQRKIYKGAIPLNCAVVFLVYRESPESLDIACSTLANSCSTAKVVRERNIAAAVWLEALPITWRRLLHSSSLLSERRLTLDNETVAGVLPLTIPRSLDDRGVEFLTARGGAPTIVDLFAHAQHALVTGTTGSGKSVVLWHFILDALAQNIPVVGMDIPAAGGSSFKTAIELLGDKGAYFDISRHSSNLMEPPDLRRFNQSDRAFRMKTWRSFIRNAICAIAMGRLEMPHLAQRVDSILMRSLDIFLSDPDIIERYNLAFSQGWKSAEWQNMPTLGDFLRYCSVARLGIDKPSSLDHQAINQITAQIKTLLASPLGDALGKPSSFSPEPLVKFFALVGLSNEQDAYVMAISAQAACVRVALSYPKSLFVGDELSVLFRRAGFSTMVGELCATARKEGLSILLSAQDPDTICESVAASMILQNITYRITGVITSSAVDSFRKYFGYPAEIISGNASESFYPRRAELCSCWLIEKGGRFWETRFYPGDMSLACVANNPSEWRARKRVMDLYPNTSKGQLYGLADFTQQYIPALKANRGLANIGKKEDVAKPNEN